jgi:serine phosphatase RsbU (regulator of sigma subunit)
MAAQNELLQTEFTSAGKLHSKKIQKKLPDASEQIQFALWYEPLLAVGGDYYRVIQLNENQYSIFLGDITGHGISAALYYNILHLSFESAISYLPHPGKLIKKLNEALYGKLDGNFVTAIAVFIDLKKRIIKYCSAGHPKAFLYYYKSSPRNARFLRPCGKIIGLFNKLDFREEKIEYSDHLRLVVYTDGITETFNQERKIFGERRFLNALEETQLIPIESAIEKVKTTLNKFSNDIRAEDDRCLIITQIKLLE